MAIDLDKMITAAEKRLQPRFDRMLDDLSKRYFLEPYVFKIKDKTFKEVESVTLNDSWTYGDKVIGVLGTAKRRIEVKHPDQKLADKAETFLNLMLDRAEESLMYSSQLGLEDSQNFYASLFGTIAGRGILYRDGDLWYPEVIPLDTSALIFQTGKKGCIFTDFKAKRSADDIFRDHEYEAPGTEAEVEDIWTVDQNIVKVDGKKIKSVPNPLQMNPVIVALCPTTPLFVRLPNAIKNQAESIYAGVRDMYDLGNREGSAWATQNMLSILPTMQYKGNKKAKASDSYGVATVISMDPNEPGYSEMPIKDLSASHQRWFGEVMSRIQRSTMSNVDYGDLSFELSALAIKRLESARDQLFVPRLKAKRIFMTILCYNLIQQFVLGGYPTDLKSKGLGESIDFDPADFKDAKFVIKIDYFADSPDEAIADLTIANTARALGLPDEYIFSNILHIENMTELFQMKDIQDAGKMSATIAKYRQARQLLARGRDEDKVEAEIIASEIGMTIQGGKVVPSGISNPPSQPGIPLGLNMPTVGTPRTPEESIGREEARRRGIRQQPARVIPAG